MTWPAIPQAFFIIVPLFFIFLVLFTDCRFQFTPKEYISHGNLFSSLIIGFIFLYAMQKYDVMYANFPVVTRNIIYLEEMALKYDQPQLICFLIQYLDDFLNFINDKFPIANFERKLLPHVTNKDDVFRIREAVTTLEVVANQRITGTNLIAQPIWYTIFIVAILLTIISPMDINYKRRIDSIIIIVLIWLPIVVVYILYNTALAALDTAIKQTKKQLQCVLRHEGIVCPPSEVASNAININRL